MDLFLSVDDGLTKQAVAKKILSGNPAQQQTEIIDAAYKQHPFLGHYQLDLVESNREPQRGYMYGYLSVTHPRPTPMQAVQGTGVVQNPSVEQDMQNPSMPMAKIPVIVKANQLFPLDVMITPDEKICAMTEDRLAVSMKQFRPLEVAPQQGTPGITGGIPGVNSTEGQAPGSGIGGTLGPNARMMPAKMASVLDMALTTMTEKSKTAMLQSFSEDVELQAAYERNPAFRAGINKIAKTQPDKTKTAGAILSGGLDNIQPDVMQFSFAQDGGILVKQAHAAAFCVQTEHISPADAEVLPSELLHTLVKEEQVTFSRSCELNTFPIEKTAYIDPKETGTYGALTKEAGVVEGIVIPHVVDRAGEKIEDQKLFLGDGLATVSMQEKIAAVHIPPGPEAALSVLQQYSQEQDPQGYGCFVKFAGADSIAMQPVHIGSRIVEGDQVYYSYGSEIGEIRKFAFVEGLRLPQEARNFDAVPTEWSWVPLPKTNTGLMEHGDNIEKAAQAELYDLSVSVVHSNGDFTLSGSPVDAVPRQERTMIKRADADFILGAAGANDNNRELLLDRAVATGSSSLAVGRSLTPLEDGIKEAQAKLSPFVDEIAELKPASLLKEAAALADPESVDSVLALGFVTPDNLVGFVDSIETLDQSAARLAEMLLATRMGDLPDIPEVPTERAMKALEKIIHGLRNLQARLEADDIDADPTQG